MLVHSSSMPVRSCWILAITGTRCCIRQSRESQTCSMSDMSGEYATTGTLSASKNCVQIHLCSSSITDACPYHNPTATMGHTIHNINIRKPLTHTMPHTLSAICPEQCKPGFIHEENTSPTCRTPANVSICPLKSVTTTNWSQVETPMRTTSMQMSFPETVSDSLCRNSLVM
uniref:Uncharacterized protein n=1 Tax=Fundulus heteroclitus TaxID=8078 RepID=A0A146PWK5_FUNHE